MTVSGNLPDRFGAYRIVGRLGRGAMGVVYAARDERGREVALKVMLPEIVADEHARVRFLREAQAAARLQHRNIVTVYDCGVDENDCPYIAMELLSGTTLAARLSSGDALSLEAKLDIVIQLCEGLQYAHDNRVVHRDVKPANIWLLSNGGVKLLDFGVAKIDGVSVTQHGGIVGSAGYMAPEQLKGQDIDARVDVFAAGAVLYELIAGRSPFAAPSVTAVMNNILQTTPAPLAAVVPGIADAIDTAVATALQKDPDLRYPSAAELGTDLRLAKYVGVTSPISAAVGVDAAVTTAAPAAPADGTLIAPRPAPVKPATQPAGVMATPSAPSTPAAAGAAPAVPHRAAPLSARRALPWAAGAAVILVAASIGLTRLAGKGASAATTATPAAATAAPVASGDAPSAAASPRQPAAPPAAATPSRGHATAPAPGAADADRRNAAAPAIPHAAKGEPVAVHLTGGYAFEVSGCGQSSAAASDHEIEVTAPCTLRMRAPEYLLDSSRTIDASGGRVEIAAPQLARVQLRSRFEWCTVILDGHAVGSPPIERELAAGSYIATIQCPDKSYTTRAFFIDPGRTIRRLDEFLP